MVQSAQCTYVVEVFVARVEKVRKRYDNDGEEETRHHDDLPELMHVNVGTRPCVNHVQWQHENLRLTNEEGEHLKGRMNRLDKLFELWR